MRTALLAPLAAAALVLAAPMGSAAAAPSSQPGCQAISTGKAASCHFVAAGAAVIINAAAKSLTVYQNGHVCAGGVGIGLVCQTHAGARIKAVVHSGVVFVSG